MVLFTLSGWDARFLTAQTVCNLPPAIQWDKTLGGDHSDFLKKILVIPEGGYLIAGSSSSNMSFEKSQNKRGVADYWIIRLDALGNKIWDRTYGGGGDESLTDAILMPDGGFILGGYSNTNISGEKSAPNKGFYDYWLVRIDASGNKIWDRTFGGNNYDVLNSMTLLPDGHVLLCGSSLSSQSYDKSQLSRGSYDAWVVKMDASQGTKIWDRTYGGYGFDSFTSVLVLSDGGFLFGGSSNSSNSGEKSGYERGGYDYWILKTDASGIKVWDQTYGGTEEDRLNSMIKMPDGSFILGGASRSEKTGEKSENSNGDIDYWIIKIDPLGNKIWDKTLGGGGAGTPSSLLTKLLLIKDGNFLAGGYSYSSSSQVKSESSRGNQDYWVLKMDAQGNRLWDKTLGAYDSEYLYDMAEGNEGEYLLGGSSYSTKNFEKSEDRRSLSDYWILKLSENIPLTLKAYLINADTDQVIREIKDGDQIQEETLGTKNLTIEIRANKGDIGSMKIQLNGTVQIQKNENLTPYSLFGKIPPFDFQGGTIPLGQYSLTATPYCANNLQGTQGDPLNINFSILKEIPSPVSRFVLVNAQTGQDIQEIKEGDVIDLDQVGTNFLSIRAESNGAKFGSLFLELKGNQSNYIRTENIAPYTLFGDQGPQYYGRNICPGNYSMKATPYTGTNKTGTAQKPLEIKFQIKGASYLNIQSLTLINAGTNQDIAPLTDGMKITQIPAGISIRANADPCVESLYFLVRDSIPGEANLYHVFVAQVENTAPYALRGDGPGGDYYPWYPEPGKYILEVIANSADQFRGVSGVKKIIRFEILAPNASSQLESSTVMSLYPNPSSQDEVHLSLDMHWTGKAQLIVRDKQGNVILSRSISDQEIDLNTQTLKPGYYLIEVQTAEGVFRKPLIKN